MKSIFNRSIYNQIKPWLFQKRVIILYGARQVGKTTLSKKIVEDYQGIYLNCERLSVQNLLEQKNIELLLAELGNRRLVVFDEAQKIKGIGEILKYFVDEYPDVQYIATGSSSFDLANETAEPLTGRKVTFELYPLSIKERNTSPLMFEEELSEMLIYGSYPAIVDENDKNKRETLLSELASDYLYKDVLQFQQLKKPELLIKLLKMVALQLGSEVSHHELANALGTSSETVNRYLDLLEKTFVIKRVHAFSRNPRKEISKSQKIYFYDLGIRNALIENYAPMDIRTDKGSLWENFCYIERVKRNQRRLKNISIFFWRTYAGQEVDLVEVEDDMVYGYEIKFNNKKNPIAPSEFSRLYKDAHFEVITPGSAYQWLE